MKAKDGRGNGLSPQDEQLLQLVLEGRSDSEIGLTFGVDRSTIYRRRQPEPFQSELRRRQAQLREALENRLQALATKAMDVLDEKLGKGDGHIALAVVRMAWPREQIARQGRSTNLGAEVSPERIMTLVDTIRAEVPQEHWAAIDVAVDDLSGEISGSGEEG